MENLELLEKHGLFDARVPRYTSYPPANHFQPEVGQRHQPDWLQAVPDGSDVSVYIHIPFCKRLCYFCACRTQGTKTRRPVEAYVDVLLDELRAVRDTLPSTVKMTRLHLGGGTPTILSSKTMALLLRDVFDSFETAEGFEFSVEIDPTDAAPELIDTLAAFGLTRASIGVQDFAQVVQDAIGRQQSFAQTLAVVDQLRGLDVASVNLDLLYGLPFQTPESFQSTLEQVLRLRPERLAIYGYAHVPWMSKRQVMIKEDTLPGPRDRFALAEMAQHKFLAEGYVAVGIDHFAVPSDGLAIAANEGRLRRNFQGYTDDTSPTLIGLGASAISRFGEGYLQNAVSTCAYLSRVQSHGMAGHKGYKMRPEDDLTARVIEDLMCAFAFRKERLVQDFPEQSGVLREIEVMLMRQFADVFHISSGGLQLRDAARPLARIIASQVDGFLSSDLAHASAI